jgi:hypothetical protein
LLNMKKTLKSGGRSASSTQSKTNMPWVEK